MGSQPPAGKHGSFRLDQTLAAVSGTLLLPMGLYQFPDPKPFNEEHRTWLIQQQLGLVPGLGAKHTTSRLAKLRHLDPQPVPL